MKWVHYLNRREFYNDPDRAKSGAPEGFIFHVHEEGKVTDPVHLQIMKDDNVQQIQVSDDVDFRTHKIDVKNKVPVLWTEAEKARYFPEPKKWAQYLPVRNDELPDGFIHAFNSQKITRPMDIAHMEAQGIRQVEVPAHIDHYSHKIEHGAKAHREYTSEEKKKHFPPAPLSIQDHIFIAMVKKGEIDIEHVHDSILQPLNESLEHHQNSDAKLLKVKKTVRG